MEMLKQTDKIQIERVRTEYQAEKQTSQTNSSQTWQLLLFANVYEMVMRLWGIFGKTTQKSHQVAIYHGIY